MSLQAQVDNMMRNFEQIDKKQPKVEFNPKKEDYTLMVDGKSDGYIYHFTTVIDIMNDGTKLEPNQRFKRLIALNPSEAQYFMDNRKV